MALHTKKVDGDGSDGQRLAVDPLLAGEVESVPKHRTPDGPMSPEMAYQIVQDELMFDGNARLNLTTFVTTHMDPEAERLMAETFDKDMIDKDEYPRRPSLRCAASTCLAAFGTPQAPTKRPDARPRAPARPLCSEDWPSNAAGNRGGARPEKAPSVPTW
jgi:hypothetical protein